MTIERALLTIMLALFTAAAIPQEESRVQAFVSAGLLSQWCGSETRMDNEACLSYLRGAFDALQVARHAEHRSLIENADDSNTICISDLAPINQLKIAMVRYAKKNPGQLQSQAGAVFLMQMFRDTYPC